MIKVNRKISQGASFLSVLLLSYLRTVRTLNQNLAFRLFFDLSRRRLQGNALLTKGRLSVRVQHKHSQCLLLFDSRELLFEGDILIRNGRVACFRIHPRINFVVFYYWYIMINFNSLDRIRYVLLLRGLSGALVQDLVKPKLFSTSDAHTALMSQCSCLDQFQVYFCES